METFKTWRFASQGAKEPKNAQFYLFRGAPGGAIVSYTSPFECCWEVLLGTTLGYTNGTLGNAQLLSMARIRAVKPLKMGVLRP